MTKKHIRGSLIGKAFTLLICLGLAWFGLTLASTPAHAAGDDPVVAARAAAEAKALGMKYLSAAIAVGLGSIAAGISVAMVGSAAMGAVAERPELMGRSLIYVGLAEGIAIYGLVVAIMTLMG